MLIFNMVIQCFHACSSRSLIFWIDMSLPLLGKSCSMSAHDKFGDNVELNLHDHSDNFDCTCLWLNVVQNIMNVLIRLQPMNFISLVV